MHTSSCTRHHAHVINIYILYFSFSHHLLGQFSQSHSTLLLWGGGRKICRQIVYVYGTKIRYHGKVITNGIKQSNEKNKKMGMRMRMRMRMHANANENDVVIMMWLWMCDDITSMREMYLREDYTLRNSSSASSLIIPSSPHHLPHQPWFSNRIVAAVLRTHPYSWRDLCWEDVGSKAYTRVHTRAPHENEIHEAPTSTDTTHPNHTQHTTHSTHTSTNTHIHKHTHPHRYGTTRTALDVALQLHQVRPKQQRAAISKLLNKPNISCQNSKSVGNYQLNLINIIIHPGLSQNNSTKLQIQFYSLTNKRKHSKKNSPNPTSLFQKKKGNDIQRIKHRQKDTDTTTHPCLHGNDGWVWWVGEGDCSGGCGEGARGAVLCTCEL